MKQTIGICGSWIFFVMGDILSHIASYIDQDDNGNLLSYMLYDLHRSLMFLSTDIQKWSHTKNGPWELNQI
jgi:hypothetical protein